MRAAAARTRKNSSVATAARCSPETDSTCVAPATRNPSSTSASMPRRSPSTAVLRNAAAFPRTSRSIAARRARRARKAIRRGPWPSGSAMRVIAAASGTPASASMPAARRASAGSGRPGLRVPRTSRRRARHATRSPGPKSGQPDTTDSASVPDVGASRDLRQRDDQARAGPRGLGPANDRPLDLLRLFGLERGREDGMRRRRARGARPRQRAEHEQRERDREAHAGARPRAPAPAPRPRSARTRRRSATRPRQRARTRRRRRTRRTRRRAARVMFGPRARAVASRARLSTS